MYHIHDMYIYKSTYYTSLYTMSHMKTCPLVATRHSPWVPASSALPLGRRPGFLLTVAAAEEDLPRPRTFNGMEAMVQKAALIQRNHQVEMYMHLYTYIYIYVHMYV